MAILGSILLPNPVNGQQRPETSIAVTVDVPLESLAKEINAALPTVLYKAGPRREICVEAERACTKIPEFHGFKIYSRMECVDLTPRISCDLTEQAAREGPAVLSGSDKVLSLKQAVSASVSARGRGDIGKNIHQTVRARAEFTISTGLALSQNWGIMVDPTVTYRWIDRPAFKLFNLIDITVAGKVEPKLNEEIDRIKREDIPAALADLDLRGRMENLWEDVQKPIQISAVADGPPIFVHLRPESVALSALKLSGANAQISALMTGDTAVTDKPTNPWGNTTQLPSLERLKEHDGGFEIAVPIQIGYDTLTKALQSNLPHDLEIDSPVAFTVTIERVRLTGSATGMRVSLDIRPSGVGQVLPSSISFDVSPSYDPATETLHFSNIRLSGDAPRVVRWLFSGAVALKFIENSLSVSVGKEISEQEAAVRAALFEDQVQGLYRSGVITVGVDRAEVSQSGIMLDAHAKGQLSIKVKKLQLR